jgi:hypothetical protein
MRNDLDVLVCGSDHSVLKSQVDIKSRNDYNDAGYNTLDNGICVGVIICGHVRRNGVVGTKTIVDGIGPGNALVE